MTEVEISKRTKGKIKPGYGMADYYNYYKNNYKKPVNSKLYNKVISEVHQQIVNAIINDNVEFYLKYISYSLVIRKTKKVPKIKDGKLVNTMPINYKETLELWRSNPKAKEDKILIRHLNNHTSRYVFRIKLLKIGHQYYTNKIYYRFKACRSFQRDLAKRILDEDKENFDAFLLY